MRQKKHRLCHQTKHTCGETKKTQNRMSSKSRKYCLHGVCVKKPEQYYVYSCAYFAVVSSTNRLTRLFSRVLKYCGERRGLNSRDVTVTDMKLAQREQTHKAPNLA